VAKAETVERFGMENLKGWTSIGQRPITTFGSSCGVMNDIIYLIGGGDQTNLDSQSIIRIVTYCLKKLQWTTKTINGNRALNRSFHASTVVGSKILTFGGCTSLGNLGEILSVTSSAEEITCETCEASNISLKGLSASTLGLPSKNERVVLYGGSTDQNEYTSECLVFDPTATDSFQNSKISIMQTESESPPARAFHSAVVSGEHRQYLIIHGGRGPSGLLHDIWILDTSPLFLPVEPVQIDPKAKGGKGGKGAPAPSLPFWSHVALNSPLTPRCLHSSYLSHTTTGSSRSSFLLHTFGGISATTGVLSIEISSTEIIQEGPNKFTATAIPTAPPQEQEQEPHPISKRYAFSSCEIIENENPVAIFVFGGIQNPQTALPELMVLEETSSFLAHALPLLPELSPATEPPPDDGRAHLEYPSGDVYDGEVLKEDDVTYRHGIGKMSYADGSVYEVWSCSLETQLHHAMLICPCLPFPSSSLGLLGSRYSPWVWQLHLL
jgi:hypothetical protein